MTHRDKSSKSKASSEEHHLWLEALAGQRVPGLDDASFRQAEIVAGILRGGELKTGRNRGIDPEVIAAQRKSPDGAAAPVPNSDSKFVYCLSLDADTNFEKFERKNPEKEIITRVMKKLEDKGLI